MATLYSNKWEICNIDAVLFDKDGTFVDSDRYWGKLGEMRINEVIKVFNLPLELFDSLAKVIGYEPQTGKLTINGPLAILSRDEVISILTDELVKNNNIKTDTIEIAKIFEQVHSMFLENMFEYTFLIDGAKQLFEKLENSFVKMAVVTSDTYNHTVETLKYLNIDKYFDCIVGCDLLSLPKKTGAPALFALEKLHVSPQNACVIGDAQMDALMSKNGGLNSSILVTTGQVPKNELQTLSNYVVDSLNEVQVK